MKEKDFIIDFYHTRKEKLGQLGHECKVANEIFYYFGIRLETDMETGNVDADEIADKVSGYINIINTSGVPFVLMKYKRNE